MEMGWRQMIGKQIQLGEVVELPVRDDRLVTERHQKKLKRSEKLHSIISTIISVVIGSFVCLFVYSKF